jgi:hypothetical protein
MIVEQFDRRTMAKMEAALARVCERFPHGSTTSVSAQLKVSCGVQRPGTLV